MEWHSGLNIESIQNPLLAKSIRLLKRGGALQEVNDALLQLLSDDQSSDLVYYGLAICARGIGDYPLSIYYFKKIKPLYTEMPQAYLQFRSTVERSTHFLSRVIKQESVRRRDGVITEAYFDTWFENLPDPFLSVLWALILDKPHCFEYELDRFVTSVSSCDDEHLDRVLVLLESNLHQSQIGFASSDTIQKFIELLNRKLLNEYQKTESDSKQLWIFKIACLTHSPTIGSLRFPMLKMDDEAIAKLMQSAPRFTFQMARSLSNRAKAKPHLSDLLNLIVFLGAHNNNEKIHQKEIENYVTQLHQNNVNSVAKFQTNLKMIQANCWLQGIVVEADIASRLLAISEALIERTETKKHIRHARVLSQNWVIGFGHLGILQLFMQANQMQKKNLIPSKINVPEHILANKAMVELLSYNGFQPQNIDDAEQENCQHLFTRDLARDFGEKNYPHLKLKELQAAIQKNKPKGLIALPDNWINAGNQRLAMMGVSAETPITLIHCRSGKFRRNLNSFVEKYRSVDFASYIPTLKFLLEDKGQTVIRIGSDEAPSKAFEHTNYFELHSESPEDEFFDYFLLWRANFFIGTNSGPAAIAQMFGTKSLFTNWYPLGVHISNLYENVRVLPKLVKKNRKFATLSEMLAPPLYANHFPDSISFHDHYEIIDNNSNDILHSAVAFIQNDQSDQSDQSETASTIWQQTEPDSMCLCPVFLKQHAGKLIPNN